MVTLSPRLATVAKYVPAGQPFVDIGTDHAYLPAFLIQQGTVPWAIAGDILPGPLEAAKTTVAEGDLTDRITLRLGSGLQVLRPGEVPCATVCGMGGALIAEILAAGTLVGIERLVLQPMGGEERLREWLVDNGWRLIHEELVEDAGRIYVVLVAEPGLMSLTESEALVGPLLIHTQSRLLVRYVEILLNQLRRAVSGAKQSDRQDAQIRVEILAHRIRILEEVIKHAAGHSRSGS